MTPPTTTENAAAGPAVPDYACPGCADAIAHVQQNRTARACAVCEERYEPSPHPADREATPARRRFMLRVETDLPLLARWLPQMLARSPALVRNTGSVGHTGSTSAAHGGRLDFIDESRGYSRAVAVWRHLREEIVNGEGERVARLWTFWVLAPTSESPERQHRLRCEAVASGAAPRVLRKAWRERAAERDEVKVIRAPLMVPTGAKDEDEQPIVRLIYVKHGFITGVKGPSFEALAMAWGREQLAPLWAPAQVPDELATRVACGFVAGEGERGKVGRAVARAMAGSSGL